MIHTSEYFFLLPAQWICCFCCSELGSAGLLYLRSALSQPGDFAGFGRTPSCIWGFSWDSYLTWRCSTCSPGGQPALVSMVRQRGKRKNRSLPPTADTPQAATQGPGLQAGAVTPAGPGMIFPWSLHSPECRHDLHSHRDNSKLD